MVDELSVIIGTSAELHCDVSGVPQPTVGWLREGQLITFVDHPNLRVDNNGQTLHIHNMQLIDIGAYTCVASNAAGNHSKQFVVNILGLSINLTTATTQRARAKLRNNLGQVLHTCHQAV